MSNGRSKQAGDKENNDKQSEDPSHPGMSPDPVKRGRQLGHENAHGGQCVGTGGHGYSGIACSNQPIGGKHLSDPSQFTQEQLHPGMNPNPVERGRQLGHENARGGRCVGTGGHGPSNINLGK